MDSRKIFYTGLTALAAVMGGTGQIALAQSEEASRRGISVFLEEVVVTARKRSSAESLQIVPVAAAAFNSDQLDAMQFKDLSGLSYSMPNVAMDDVGTYKGTANFSIRGLGITASIPSIDPTVGIFVDGMYLGVNNGVVIDMFDLESIEVLRGPQGLLFGRNVTGGAVVINSKRPTDEFSFNVKSSVTDDMDKILAASVSGPLSDELKVRLSGYYNDDDGWFKNDYRGSDYGGSETTIIKPSFLWEPTDTASLIVRLEHGEIDGDGAANQNFARFKRGTFDFSSDETSQDIEWDQAIAEVNIDVAFGEGTITNILAWRDLEFSATFDPDGLGGFPATFSRIQTYQDQLSNELRYAGMFNDGKISLTTGAFWFTQDVQYFDERGGIGFGGEQEHTAVGYFLQTDINLNETVVLTLGGRYSKEDKDAKVASFSPPAGLCDLNTLKCTFDFKDDEDWDSFTPKVGLQWLPNDNMQAYITWTKGFRSGNYNLRNTVPGVDPGPVDQEEVDAYEMGFKADWLDGKIRTNIAVFRNEISDMQREVNLPAPPPVNNVQLIRNTADATIDGIELEVIAAITDSLLITAHYGYLDGTYDDIWFDLTGDGVIDDADYDLDIPRLAPKTWGISLNHELEIGGFGYLSSRVSFNHRDEAAFTDNNVGMLSEADIVDASIAFTMLDEHLTLSVFGKNLTDEVTYGAVVPLPPLDIPFGGPGATISTLSKGRVLGIEVRYQM